VAATFAVLVAGVVVSTAFWFRAEGQRERAERQTAKAEAATEFMRDMLVETIPRGFGDQVTIAEMLDLSRENLSSAFPDEPEVEADVCRSVGWGYLNLSRMEDAELQWKRALALRSQALGRDHPKTLESLADLALCYRVVGRWEEAAEADRWTRDSLVRTLGEEDPRALQASYSLAAALGRAGRLQEAEELAAETAATMRRVLGPTQAETLDAEILEAGFRMYRGEAAESETMSRELLATAERALGRDHPTTRSARSQLGAALVTQGQVEEARAVYTGLGVPEEFGVQDLFQGDFDPESGRTQVLVFWETWCPFSTMAVPKLEEFYQRYRAQGIDIIGISQVDRSATGDTMRRFIAEAGLSFPILKSNRTPWNYYNVGGTPWVTVIRDGEMVWESYLDTPEKIPGMMFEGLARGM
jgi:tetratricopeptide (TPR) repeat protein